MIIDGKSIADKILERVKVQISKLQRSPVLVIVMVGQDPATEKFVSQKQKVASDIGAEVRVVRLEMSSSDDLVDKINQYNSDAEVDGIIIQLPLPTNIDTDRVLNAVTCMKDVDVLSRIAIETSLKGDYLSPVVGAVKTVIDSHCVEVKGKSVLVVGRGRLVGKPVEKWFENEGAKVTSADNDTANLAELTLTSDIIVSGAGKPGLIKPVMLSDGVMLIDAGTSVRWGKTVGDADPACAKKCELFTPVPGGIGIITVAKLFENLANVAKMRVNVQA
jgi:methylenetetrahydrofolate dehydrogenase (NADP+) / methenyltetrahydrofolate cyclohydrolase